MKVITHQLHVTVPFCIVFDCTSVVVRVALVVAQSLVKQLQVRAQPLSLLAQVLLLADDHGAHVLRAALQRLHDAGRGGEEDPEVALELGLGRRVLRRHAQPQMQSPIWMKISWLSPKSNDFHAKK